MLPVENLEERLSPSTSSHLSCGVLTSNISSRPISSKLFYMFNTDFLIPYLASVSAIRAELLAFHLVKLSSAESASARCKYVPFSLHIITYLFLHYTKSRFFVTLQRLNYCAISPNQVSCSEMQSPTTRIHRPSLTMNHLVTLAVEPRFQQRQ